MPGSAEPEQVAARHQLGLELRRLRERAGLTGQDLAAQLGWSQSKVSRIEQARTRAPVSDIQALLGLLDVPVSARDQVIALAERAAAGSWRNSTGVGLTRRQQDFIALEASASEIYHYNPVLLPGYMQSEEYARRVIDMAGASNEERAVEYRLARRLTMLGRSAPRYRVVLLETALRWRPVPPDIMARQLGNLAEYAARDNVDLRILAFDQEQSSFMQHPLMVFRFDPPAPARGLLETTAADYHLTDTPTVERLIDNFEQLSSSALSPSDSLALIRKAARDLVDSR
ncbi:Helix-turn-helix domain-containing protein [Micromonospora echinaurantiaca]|uniref:Helix-turn-helix domain-containing protein n=1 Tax=Micromonospora echinaurantiaca TaxID=47857 RepID=A0A1C5K487_9ACTN|nr:Helix-turn-helix domain-containing protein [Micromonospora echinaurantiaca]